jgi:ubiquinone/menaquinone biosynthesis C-methylase UbiE
VSEAGEVFLEQRLATSTGPAVTCRGAAGSDAAPARSDRGAVIPAYLYETYRWAYLDPKLVPYLDRATVVSSILWGNYRRLRDAALAELRPGDSVLQPACVYGDFSVCLAQRLGPQGRLLVSDVTPLQIENCERKLARFEHAETALCDAADHAGAGFDAVCCFFLLHEMPDDHRRRALDSLLAAVRPGGKAIFVDYHKPHWSHPLRPVMSAVFAVLEPYAKGLWQNELWDLAGLAGDFDWSKETWFGGLYQKTVARPKA